MWYLRWRAPPGMGIGDGDMGCPMSMVAEKREPKEGGAADAGALADSAAIKQGRRGMSLVKNIMSCWLRGKS